MTLREEHIPRGLGSNDFGRDLRLPPHQDLRVVGHLQVVSPVSTGTTPDQACLDAFQRELDYVYRTFRRLGAPPSEVDDLAQELFLVLRGTWTAYDPSRPLRPYLFGIAFRIAAANHRKRRRELSVEVVEADDGRPGPDEALEAKQSRALLLAALEKVPLPRRAVLVMYDIDDMPMDQVAAALAIPRFTAYSRLRKARRELEAVVKALSRGPGT